MSNNISIDYQKFISLLAKFSDNLTDTIDAPAEHAMGLTLLYLKKNIPPYPSLSPSTRLQNPDGASFLKTDKQRRWFFANLKEGKIKGWRIDAQGNPEKYATNRSDKLGRSFTTEVEISPNGSVVGNIGTAIDYAPWVVGDNHPGSNINGKPMYQAKVHVDRWWQFEEEMVNRIDDAEERFNEEFFEEFKKEWLK